MSPAEWNACVEPQAMLAFLRAEGTLTERKARLFAVACCRSIWPLLTDQRSIRGVEVAEAFADGLTDEKACIAARKAATQPIYEIRETFYEQSRDNDHRQQQTRLQWTAAATVACSLRNMRPPERAEYWAREAAAAAHETATLTRHTMPIAEEQAQERLLRDVFNPFRPATPNAAWLTATATSLAKRAYEHRILPQGTLDPALLAALAQALAEASCTDAELLEHLRSPGPHFRGCWGVDIVLAKT